MADFKSVKYHFDSQILYYCSFFPKYGKHTKDVIRDLPHNTSVEEISDGLVSLGFDIIVKQMTANRRSAPEKSSS
jgi:hypothetical protein